MIQYKFFRAGLVSDHDGSKWVVGEWRDMFEEVGAVDIECCEHGFHCSPNLALAFQYVHGEVAAEVEVEGNCDKEKDKSAWQRMRIVRTWKWGKGDSVKYAQYAAEKAKKHSDDAAHDAADAAARTAAAHDAHAAAAYAAADAAHAAYAAAYASARAAGAADASARAAAYEDFGVWMLAHLHARK